MIILSLEESNNFDNYLKELGVGFILRQLAQVVFIVIGLFFLNFIRSFFYIYSFIFYIHSGSLRSHSQQ